MWPDPDGLELQLFQPPAGLVTAAVDSPLPVDGDGIVSPLGVDHVMLNVSSLDKALPYYRGVYGAAAEGKRDANGRVWFRSSATPASVCSRSAPANRRRSITSRSRLRRTIAPR